MLLTAPSSFDKDKPKTLLSATAREESAKKDDTFMTQPPAQAAIQYETAPNQIGVRFTPVHVGFTSVHTGSHHYRIGSHRYEPLLDRVETGS
jgi:hypothetical protein